MRIICFLLLSLTLYGAPSQRYFDLLDATPKTHGIQGSSEKGEIEILTHALSIEEAENEVMDLLLQKNIQPELAWEWSRVGIVAEDQYLFWVRDAVAFPSGKKGTYDRIIWKSSLEGSPGVAIFPYLEDQKVILILQYRHATRSWELEIPRGGLQKGETIQKGATRELLEETGYHTDHTLLLGTLAVDSGILGSLVPVLACKALESTESSIEYSEAIHGTVILSASSIQQALIKGFWDVSIGDKTIRAAVRDPFLAYALLQMKLRNWQD